MPLTGTRVTVTTSPTPLVTTQPEDHQGITAAIRVPLGGSAVDIGSSSVTAGGGWQILPGEFETVTLRRGENVYGVVAAGTQQVQVLQIPA